MSYPQPRYAGDTGQVSATARRASEPPDLPCHSGNAVHYLATPREEYFETLGELAAGTLAMTAEQRLEFYPRLDNIWI